MTRTDILASATKTAVYTDDSGVDISGLSDDWTVFVEIEALSSASGTPTAVIHFQDVEAADFTSPRAGPTFAVTGTIPSVAPKRYSFSKRDFPHLPVGDTNGKIRIQVPRLGGTTPSITLRSWIETYD